MPLKDPETRRAYHREYMKRYLADPAKKRDHLKRVARNNKSAKSRSTQLVNEWKKGGCRLCSEKLECCLVAHHLDPSKKEFAIGDALSKGFWPKRVVAELEKCVCLCMNCHAKLHAGLVEYIAS